MATYLGPKMVLIRDSLASFVAKVYEEGNRYVCEALLRLMPHPLQPTQAQFMPLTLVGSPEKLYYDKDEVELLDLPQAVENKYIELVSGIVVPTPQVGKLQ